jgi:hypothetical protein
MFANARTMEEAHVKQGYPFELKPKQRLLNFIISMQYKNITIYDTFYLELLQELYLITIQFWFHLVSTDCLPFRFAGHQLKKGGPCKKQCLNLQGVLALLMELYGIGND